MTTLTIPLTTLPVGSRDLGPSSPSDAEHGFTLTIDRTVTGGLNSLTSSSVLALVVFQSNDGGTTWHELGATAWQGGPATVRGGGTRTQEQLITTLNPGTSRQVKVTVTVSGTSIAVAGSLVTT